MHLSVERTYVTHVTIDVPPEVLDNIFQRLRTRDIKSVRLVCGSFNVAASRYLVDRIYLSSSTRDLNTIDAISKHATFSKCVTQVVFDCRIYEERIATDRRRYSRAVRRRPFEADSLVWTRTMVDDSYEKYVERYRQQQECFRTDSDTRCLLTALPLLPRLTEVTFTGDRCEKLWPRTASHCGPLTDRTDEVVVVQPSVEASYTMDTMTADEMESHQQICHSRILHMLRTLAASPLTGRLRSFKLGNSFPGTFALSYKIFDADVEYAGNLEILFRHLRKLHLVISAGPIQHPRQNLSSNIRIGKILTRAEKLEALSLSLNSYSSDRADSVNLTQLIGMVSEFLCRTRVLICADRMSEFSILA